MKIKQFAKKVVQGIKDAGKVALYTSPFWLPTVLEAKALDLQATKTGVTQDYMHGAWLKSSKTGYSFYAGNVTDLSHGFYFDAGVGNLGINGAILGKDLGLEASTDLKGKKVLTLDTRVLGTGLSATGTVDSEGKTAVSGSAFRAEQIGKGTYFGKIDANKDNVTVSGLGFYVGPTIGSLTLVPLAYFSKPVTSSGYYFMTGVVGLNGKVSVSGTVMTTDFKDFAPSLKVAYKF